MWGSTFTDFAAQLQEQASEAASNLSTTPTTFFNLDSMQNDESSKPKGRVETIKVPEEPKPTPTVLNFPMDMMSTPQPIAKKPTGKLVVPKVPKTPTPAKRPPPATPLLSSTAQSSPRADTNDRMNGHPVTPVVGTKLSIPSVPKTPVPKTPPPVASSVSVNGQSATVGDTKEYVNGETSVPSRPEAVRPQPEAEEQIESDGWDEDMDGLDLDEEADNAKDRPSTSVGVESETKSGTEADSLVPVEALSTSQPAVVETEVAVTDVHAEKTQVVDEQANGVEAGGDVPVVLAGVEQLEVEKDYEESQPAESTEVSAESPRLDDQENDGLKLARSGPSVEGVEDRAIQPINSCESEEPAANSAEKEPLKTSEAVAEEVCGSGTEFASTHIDGPEEQPAELAETTSIACGEKEEHSTKDESSQSVPVQAASLTVSDGIAKDSLTDKSDSTEMLAESQNQEASRAVDMLAPPTPATVNEEQDSQPVQSISDSVPENSDGVDKLAPHTATTVNEEHDSQPEQSISDSVPEKSGGVERLPPSAGVTVDEEQDSRPEQSIPDSVLEKFSDQMKRMEEGFQYERLEMEQAHARELQNVMDSFNHDACERERRDLEELLKAQIYEKESQIHELMRVNEGQKLKLDVLKREVEGTQALLQAKEADVGQASEEHSRTVTALQEKLADASSRVATAQREAKKLQAALESSKEELVASRQEHADLKARVKVVATELKDRRVECRDLKARVDELQETKQKLQQSIEGLEDKLFSDSRTRNEKQSEIEGLRTKLIELESTLERNEKDRADLEAKNDKVLADYKKKAQNSLALANARTAASVQAREEAEMEARAARSTADSAMERALKAEAGKKEACAGFEEAVAKMRSERDSALRQFEEAQSALTTTQQQLVTVEEKLRDSAAAREKAAIEHESVTQSLRSEQSKASALAIKIRELNTHESELQDEVSQLRERLRATETRMADGESKDSDKQASPRAISGSGRESDRETIMALQQELEEANDAIDGLKEALRNAVEMSEKKRGAVGVEQPEDSSHGADVDANGGNGSTPLFYAMEKQAELRLATGEINRLANLLSDVEAEKTAAEDSREEMRKRMEEAEARLARFEKLQSTQNGGVAEGAQLNGSAQSKPANGGAVNIEYLKNIMMSFLNAKTVTERKALVPVIGAVLCLTPDEVAAAVNNLEKSTSIGGVSNSLFESFTGRF